MTCTGRCCCSSRPPGDTCTRPSFGAIRTSTPVSGSQQFFRATGSPDHGGDSWSLDGEKGHPSCHPGLRCPLLALVSSAGPFPVCPAHPALIANWALCFHPIFVANGSADIDLRKGVSQSSTCLRACWRLRLRCASPLPRHVPLVLPFAAPLSLNFALPHALSPLFRPLQKEEGVSMSAPPQPREGISPFPSHSSGWEEDLSSGSLRGGRVGPAISWAAP